jgi:hypothetical protein
MGQSFRYSYRDQPEGLMQRGKPASTRAGITCLVLFLLPFAAVGIVTAGFAVDRLAASNWQEALFFGLFALTFGGIGLGGIAAALAAVRKLKERDILEARYSDQPWLWRQDWASGKIRDETRNTLLAAWIFTTLWNLVSLPVGFFGTREALQQENYAILAALLFPLVGIGFLTWAVRGTIRYRKYGTSTLQLSTIPGVVGRTLAGTISVPGSLRPAAGFLLTLGCIRRVTRGAGKNRSTSEDILWQEDRQAHGTPSRDPRGMFTIIPVIFRIPPDATSTDSSDPRDSVLWRLRVSAEVPGVDYDSVFEVPVFRTAASEQPLTDHEEQLTRDPLAEGTYQQPSSSRIIVTANRRGTEIFFPAARNPGAATVSTMFTLFWLAGIAFQLYLDVPVIFPIIFGLFSILLVVSMLDLWLGVSRVRADGGTLTLETGYLYPGRDRRLNASDVADVKPVIGMTSGSTPYYDVVVLRKDGKKIKVGRGVRDKLEAEWLAAILKRGLG